MILVIGGTHGTGLLIAQRLTEQGRRVRVLARRPARATEQLGPVVEVVAGDITKPETLDVAVEGMTHIVFTAGVRSGRLATEPVVKRTDHDGPVNTLAAARRRGFRGRFLYMTSIGGPTRSMSATLLNLIKGNTLDWRRRVEDAIRASGFDYTIIRAGFLLNSPGGRRAVHVSQGDLPLSPRYHIARADVADAFVDALEHPRASRATFEVAWGAGPRTESWSALLDRLIPDAGATPARARDHRR